MDAIKILAWISHWKDHMANQNALDGAARQEELLRQQCELRDRQRQAEAMRSGEGEQLPPHSQPPGTVPNSDVFVHIDPTARPPE